MTNIYNEPEAFKDETLRGFVSAYARYIEQVPGASGVMRRGGPSKGKVSVVIGGGSGHYPAFIGLVGAGFADGAVAGDIFTSPSMEQAYQVGRHLDGGAGVLMSYGNYAGDVMNFGAAQDRLLAEGTECRTVLVTDDLASAPVEDLDKRRGIAGDFCVFKVAGAAADRGEPLAEVERLALRANAMTRTFGVAFDGCTFPGADEPLFTVEPGQMDLGLGIHGEPGVRSAPLLPANELAGLLLQPILEERPAEADGRAAVIVNGLGATKYEELFVLWGALAPLLEAEDVRIVMPEVGELVTSLDMSGCSVTLMWLDDELEELWLAPVDTPGFRRGDVSTLQAFDPADDHVADPVADAEVSVGPAGQAASVEAVAAGEFARHALGAMLGVVREHEEELGRIDAVAGDGDHGVGMVRGLRAATAAADATDGGVGQILVAAGTAWADKAGGTSGMLWGALLQTIGRSFDDTTSPSAQMLLEGLEAAAEEVGRLGRSGVGDKTMLDALVPFVRELRAGAARGDDLADAWRAAAAVAIESASATADLVPQVGRARPLAERSVGTPDAGATSLALCVDALAPTVDTWPC